MGDAKIAAIGRQLADALSLYAHERTSPAGAQAQKDIARLHWELCTAVGDESVATVVAGEAAELVSPRFARGDEVIKSGGDYTYRGHVAIPFYKLDNRTLRYAVQDARGLLMIMNEGQLRPAGVIPGGKE